MKSIILTALLCLSMASMANAANIHSYKANDIDGKEVELSQYKGKVLLIVNTASKCGYTRQYKALQELYANYKDQGLVVLGFPANNFREQEPGSNEEIKKFCALNFNVSFPMMSKISVAGEDTHPMYQYLTGHPDFGGSITWNFNKFLVSKEGEVLSRFDSGVDPLSPEFIAKVEEALAK